MTSKGYFCPLNLACVCLIVLVSFFVPSVTFAEATGGCDTTKVTSHFTLVFNGVTYDYDAGTSTWDYTLTWDGVSPALSYFFIQLCSQIKNENLISVTPSYGQIGYNGNLGLWGLKWDDINNFPANQPVQFSFTLNKLLAVDHTQFAPKAGVNSNLARICGPSKYCEFLQNPCEVFVSGDFVLQNSYKAQSINGELAPPPYGLRLDGFFEGNGDKEATWGFDNVRFDEFTNGIARLHGTISLVEYNNSGGPGVYASTWDLDIFFNLLPDAIAQTAVQGYNPSYRYYNVLPQNAIEMINQNDAGDYANLWEHPPNNRRPFQVGFGANEKNGNFGAAGWLNYVHQDHGNIYGDSTVHVSASDLLMDLVPIECRDDTSIFLSDDYNICIPGFECRFDSCYVDNDSVFNFDGSQVCFTADTSGTYTIRLISVDPCGLEDTCVTLVQVNRKSPPVCNLPPDSSVVRICGGGDTCLVVKALDPDNDLVGCSVISGPGQIVDDTLWCYTPNGNEIVTVGIECIDSTGLSCTGTFTVQFIVENPPVVADVADSSVFLCSAEQPLCVQLSIDNYGNPFTVSSEFGEFNADDSTVCFTVNETGEYCNRVIVTNGCGQADTVEYCIEVTINSAPVASCPDSDTISVCYTQEQVKVGGFGYFDVDENLAGVTLIGGTLTGDTVSFTATLGEHELKLIVTDNCGLADTCSTLILIVPSIPPVIPPIDDQEVFICNPDTFCYDLGPIFTELGLDSVWTNVGVIENGILCVVVDSPGVYQVAVYAINECLEMSGDTFNVTVNLNQPPVVSLGEDFAVDLCGDNQICVPFSVSDNNLDSVISNFEIIGDSVCFTADEAGTYLVWVSAIDECDAISADSIYVTVSTPPAPFVSLGEDIRAKICSPTEFCVELETIDNPASIEFNRVGYDPQTGKFCWTASETILDLLKVTVTDSCGRTAQDSISVYIQFNTPPTVETPMPDTTIYLCQPDYVCLPLVFSDSENNIINVQVSHGTYDNGQVCFVPYDKGEYIIIATATDSCGALTADTAVVNIITDQYVNLNCPKDTTIFMCQHDTLCFPIGEIPEWAEVTVTGINTWFDRENQQVCFYVSCGVSNHITVTATTDCGTFSCDFTVNVVCNQPPLVFLPPDTSILLCGADSVYIPVGISDPNNNIYSIYTPDWVTYEPISGKISFYADSTGTYVINVSAIDSCELPASDQIKVHITIDEAPVCNVPNDTSVFLCAPGQISLPVYATDDSQIEPICSVVNGVGTIIDGYWVYQATSNEEITVAIECVDACGGVCSDTFTVSITINESPVCNVPNDTTIVQCYPAEICLPISATDIDGNFKICTVISGPGIKTYPVGKHFQEKAALGVLIDQQWCYTPAKDTSFYVVVRCEDSCGAFCLDSFQVTIELNEPPVVNCPGDTTLFLCALSPITVKGFAASDPNGDNLIRIVSQGTLNADSVTFTPVEGTNQIIFSAYDSCEAYAACTTYVTVNLNQPPVCQVPNDTTITGCVAESVCLPVSAIDIDENFAICQLVGGPGTIENGNWCYTPQGSETVTVIVRCYDSCEAFCQDTFTVTFDAGTPPAIENQYFSIKYCDDISERMLQVSASSNEPFTFNLLSDNGAIDSLTGVITYLPDTPGVYSFIVEVTNSCGSNSAIVYDTVKINRPPEIIGFDSTVYLCKPTEICFDVFGFDSDLDSLDIQQILGPGQFIQNSKNSGTTCFIPPSTDSIYTYLFVYQVTDLCVGGDQEPFEYYYDTVAITVILDQPPVLNIPPYLSIFACNSDSVCFRIPPHTPEEFPYTIEVLSGNAVFEGDSIACLLIDGPGDYLVEIKVTDSCGNSSNYSSTIHVEINTPPVVTLPADFATEICDSGAVCIEFNAADLDNNLVSLVANYGTIGENNTLCFDADSTGTYQIIVTATDSCGATGADTAFIRVDVNDSPVITLGDDFAIDICSTQTICLPFSVSDDNLANISSNYSISGDSVCVNLNESGTYLVWVSAIDECQKVSADSLYITVTSPPAPFVNLGDDIRAKICSPTEFCVEIETIDNPASIEFNRVGYDPQTGKFCWTASGTILDLLKVTVTDSCGRTAQDSISVYIQFNTPPTVQVAMPDTTVYLCQPSNICLPLVFADSQNNITNIQVNRGNYNNGQVCFVPYDSGTYTIIATATDSCGAMVADTAIVRVLTDQYVQLDCPNDTTVFMCTKDTLCFPIGDIPEWAQIQVTGINTWYDAQNQQVCFYVTCGVRNHIVVKAITPCGTKTCSFDVTVRCNQPPFVTMPPDMTLNLCASDTVRIPVGVSDPNNNIASVTTNSWAKYEPITGKVSFVADSSGVYVVQVTAVDSCGAQDTEDIVVNVRLNTPPVIGFALSDSIYSYCGNEVICLPVTVSDSENNVTQIIPSIGFYNPNTQSVCFMPGQMTGDLCVTVRAIDACGKADTATKCIYLINQGTATIECPPQPLFDTLCSADSICYDIPVSGTYDSIKVNYGRYLNDELCFLADSTGTYRIVLSVFTPCAIVNCTTQFNVTILPGTYVLCPENDTVFFCGPDTVFYDFASAGATSFEVTPPAFVSGSQIGVPFLSAGVKNITVIAVGQCGNDTCSFSVTGKFNSKPKVVMVPDTTINSCVLQQVCVPFTVTDSNNNVATVVGPNGPIAGNQYCFTPAGAGDYKIIITATDSCGASASDTTNVHITQGSADIFCPSGSQNRTVCRGDSVRIVVPITPYEATVQVLLDGVPNGYYNKDSALVILFPASPGSHTVRLIASAGCAADTCNISLFVNFLEKTTITCPAVIDTFVCPLEVDSICFPVTVMGTNVQVSVNSGGKYSNGTVCVPVAQGGTYNVRIIGNGACGSDTCFTTINVIADEPPVLHLPADTLIELCDFDSSMICIGGIFMEDDSTATFNKVCGPGIFEKITSDSGVVCFIPSGDFFGDYTFCFEVNDGCNSRIDSFTVTLVEGPDCDQCLVLSIDGGECVTVGSIKKVELKIESLRPIGGFEVLLSFDASVMALSTANISGTAIQGWEYFNYRMNSGACSPVCPTGILRFVGLAETNNGNNHPPANTLQPNGVLVNMYFLITNDQNVGGQFIPIRFVSYECGDNTFSDPTGNDLFVDNRIYNSENIIIWDEDNNTQFPESARQFGLGTPDSCIVGVGKGQPKRCIDFINGGICVTHPDDIDDRGDLNLNGVPYEVADAVLFTNYFIYGLGVFTVNIQGQIAASDINADGRALTVADLVMLLRILIDDADPIPKIVPHETDLKLVDKFDNGIMKVNGESIAGIGAAYFAYDVSKTRLTGNPVMSSANSSMEIKHHIDGNQMRILIYSMDGASIGAGNQGLLEIPFEGDAPVLTAADFADPDGRPYNLATAKAELPTGFELHQNYPNPFNPTTTLSFSLPVESDWHLTIYNVSGATVRNFDGANAPGLVEVFWDGRADNGGEVASGVYFYKLETGRFSQTKKMMMIK